MSVFRLAGNFNEKHYSCAHCPPRCASLLLLFFVHLTNIGRAPTVCSPGPGARSHGEQRSTPVCPRGTRFSPTSATVVQPFFPLRSLSLPLSSSPFLSPHLLTPFSPLSPRPTPLLSPSGQCPAPWGGRGQEPSERNGGETARSLAELEAV